MKTIFLLENAYHNGEYEDISIIGIYSSIEKAKISLEKHMNNPQLIGQPESFKIHQFAIDQPKILDLVT